MIRWYAAGGVDAPEAVECAEAGFPHRDAKGRLQYENSHYDTEADAWEHILADVEAQVSLAGVDVIDAQARLREVEQRAAEAAARFHRVRGNHRRWERGRVKADA